MSIDDQTCHKRGCQNPADYALHLDGDPAVFLLNEDGTQSDERITESREFYCATHAQEALEAKQDSGRIITSGA